MSGGDGCRPGVHGDPETEAACGAPSAEADALPRPGDAEPLALCGAWAEGRSGRPVCSSWGPVSAPCCPWTGHCSRAPGRERREWRESNGFIKQPGPGSEEEEVKTNDWNESVGFNERLASAVTMENSL